MRDYRETSLRKISDVSRGTWRRLGIRDISDGSTHQERANSRAWYLRLDWYVSRMSTGWRFNALSFRRAPRAEVSLRDIPPSARVSPAFEDSRERIPDHSLTISRLKPWLASGVKLYDLASGKLITILCTCYIDRLSRTFLSAYRYMSRILTSEKTTNAYVKRMNVKWEDYFLLLSISTVYVRSRSNRRALFKELSRLLTASNAAARRVRPFTPP